LQRDAVIGLSIIAVCLGAGVQAQETALRDCAGPGSTACVYDSSFVVGESCGQTFYYYRDRISWPPLVNVGPVTISISAWTPQEDLPLFVEVRSQSAGAPPDVCPGKYYADAVLIAHGSSQCGVFESVGPLDLTRLGIPLGTRYYVVVEFFEYLPSPQQLRSPGFGCINVTPSTAVVFSQMTHFKQLYR
jgi:hypothetical protein